MGKRRGHNEGSLYERDGRWVAAVTVAPGRRKYFSGRTKAEARSLMEEARRQVQLRSGAPGEISLRELAEMWLAAAHKWAPSTRKGYRSQLENYVLPELGGVIVDRLTPGMLETLYLQLQVRPARTGGYLSATSIDHVHAVIRTLLRYAQRMRYISDNPAQLLGGPGTGIGRKEYLRQEEIPRFLAAVSGDRDQALFTVAVTTGARQGELLALRWSEVDLAAGALSIKVAMRRHETGWERGDTKTKASRRHVALSDWAREALQRHLARQEQERKDMGDRWADSGLVFPNRFGRRMDTTNLTARSFKSALQRAGITRAEGEEQLVFHSLRHTAATTLLLSSVPVQVVSGMLGHSNPVVTWKTYSHAIPNLSQVAADKWNEIFGAFAVPPEATGHPSNDSW